MAEQSRRRARARAARARLARIQCAESAWCSARQCSGHGQLLPLHEQLHLRERLQPRVDGRAGGRLLQAVHDPLVHGNTRFRYACANSDPDRPLGASLATAAAKLFIRALTERPCRQARGLQREHIVAGDCSDELGSFRMRGVPVLIGVLAPVPTRDSRTGEREEQSSTSSRDAPRRADFSPPCKTCRALGVLRTNRVSPT